jgi:hypothetical protein
VFSFKYRIVVRESRLARTKGSSRWLIDAIAEYGSNAANQLRTDLKCERLESVGESWTAPSQRPRVLRQHSDVNSEKEWRLAFCGLSQVSRRPLGVGCPRLRDVRSLGISGTCLRGPGAPAPPTLSISAAAHASMRAFGTETSIVQSRWADLCLRLP